MIDHEEMILKLRKVGSSKKEFLAIFEDWKLMKQEEMASLEIRRVEFLATIEKRAERIAKEMDLIASMEDRLMGKDVILVLPSQLIPPPEPPVEEKKTLFGRKKK